MTERHDVVLHQNDDGPNPPDLLRQIVEDVKKLVPETSEAARKYVKGKGEQEVAKAQEIKARIYEIIAKLEIERQRLIQQHDEAEWKAELELQRGQYEIERAERELEVQRFKERTHALREVVDCIVKLKENGIEVNIRLIKDVEKTARSLMKDK